MKDKPNNNKTEHLKLSLNYIKCHIYTLLLMGCIQISTFISLMHLSLATSHLKSFLSDLRSEDGGAISKDTQEHPFNRRTHLFIGNLLVLVSSYQ